ncbi:rhodanese-like domain-containing protein [Uliginosibacterium aquaticum]|nr:rhodanese-like domain-containing protein [Uliginosibacterium aquaticum]
MTHQYDLVHDVSLSEGSENGLSAAHKTRVAAKVVLYRITWPATHYRTSGSRVFLIAGTFSGILQKRTMDFVSQNIFLITLAVISGLALFIPVLRDAQASTSQVSPAQAVMLLNRQNAVIVDVRETAELATGKIEGARHIPAGEIKARSGELDKFKNRPLILVCESGARSGRALADLRKAGFAQAYNLAGGIKAWKEAGQPLAGGKQA